MQKLHEDKQNKQNICILSFWRILLSCRLSHILRSHLMIPNTATIYENSSWYICWCKDTEKTTDIPTKFSMFPKFTIKQAFKTDLRGQIFLPSAPGPAPATPSRRRGAHVSWSVEEGTILMGGWYSALWNSGIKYNVSIPWFLVELHPRLLSIFYIFNNLIHIVILTVYLLILEVNERKHNFIKYLSSHHLHELVEVQRAGTVLVHLLDDAAEVVFRQLAVQLPQNLLQSLGRDVACLVLVVDTEGLL